MNIYKCLNTQEFVSGEYKIVPIRLKDRFTIMVWRNEQLYHLRQKHPLTVEDQENYFSSDLGGAVYLYWGRNTPPLLFDHCLEVDQS